MYLSSTGVYLLLLLIAVGAAIAIWLERDRRLKLAKELSDGIFTEAGLKVMALAILSHNPTLQRLEFVAEKPKGPCPDIPPYWGDYPEPEPDPKRPLPENVELGLFTVLTTRQRIKGLRGVPWRLRSMSELFMLDFGDASNVTDLDGLNVVKHTVTVEKLLLWVGRISEAEYIASAAV